MTANPHLQHFYHAKCESMPVLKFKYEENDLVTVLVFRSTTSDHETETSRLSIVSKSFASGKKMTIIETRNSEKHSNNK